MSRQLAPIHANLRTKEKLQIVMVKAATPDSAQQDSGCLWLALIRDRKSTRFCAKTKI